MERKFAVAVIIGIIIIAGVIGYQLNENAWTVTSIDEYYEKDCAKSGLCGDIAYVVYPDNPQTMYGLQINKDKYLLGENVYVVVSGIPKELKTRILFYTPSEKQFYEITIDGERSSGLKQYFKPQLLMNRNLCDVQELIGVWNVVFENNASETLQFEVLDRYLPENEKFYEKNSCGSSIELDPGFIQDP